MKTEMNEPEKPLRIALALPGLSGGGVERTVLSLARGLIERGHAVDLLLFEEIDTLADEIPADARRFVMKQRGINFFRDQMRLARRFGFRILKFLRKSLFRLQDARSIVAYIDEEKPDCILPSASRTKLATLLALCFTTRMPTVIPIMHSVIMRPRYRKLYSILFPTADHIVAVSDGVADRVALKLKIPRERISRIYNPVVSADITELARAAPAHPRVLDDGPPVILGAGRLARTKDFFTLLRAFARVSKNRDARLIILGEGRWRKRLEKMIRKLGIQDSVSLPGWVSNPYAFMSRASLFVLSSKLEGLGNVLIEALACGCPCVSTNCPAGPSEILDNGRFGPLVPVGDDTALAAAMERVLDSPPDKEVLKARAQEFSFDASVDQYERLILDLVRERRARQAL